MASDDEDYLLGPGKFNADPKKVSRLRNQMIQFTKVKSVLDDDEPSDSSSSDSSSSSSSSDEEENSVEELQRGEKVLKERELARRKLEADIMKKAEESASSQFRSTQTSTLDELKRKVKAVQRKAEAEEIDEDDEEIEEIPSRDIVQKRPRFVIEDEESELKDTEEGHLSESESESEEEEESFFLKFNLNRPARIVTNPARPLQEAFDSFINTLTDVKPNSRFVFRFDDEVIKGDVTPSDLDLESGDQIDVTVKSK